MISEYGRTIRLCAISLITISAMLAIGTLTRLSGVDATLGLAFAATGVLYPFFGTLLGWLGVALTGSDTASNILFGNLQKITSEQLGLSPVLMAAANSSGGVMGKMIDAQSIVVASTATNWYGHESSILRYVFLHSIVLACLVGVLVTLQAYLYPFTLMVLKENCAYAMNRKSPRAGPAGICFFKGFLSGGQAGQGRAGPIKRRVAKPDGFREVLWFQLHACPAPPLHWR
jgi:lactate permease